MTPRTVLALHQAVADFAPRPHDDTLEERQRDALLPAKHIADMAMASVPLVPKLCLGTPPGSSASRTREAELGNEWE